MGIAEIQTYLGYRNGGNTMLYMQVDESQAAAAFAAAVKSAANETIATAE